MTGTDNFSSSIWAAMRTDASFALHASLVEITGWMTSLDPAATDADYFLLAAQEACCGGCVPRDPFSCIEVVTQAPVMISEGPVCLRGRLVRLVDDPAGWRYRLESAERVIEATGGSSPQLGMSRRAFLASGTALSLAACMPGRFAGYTGRARTLNRATSNGRVGRHPPAH